MNKLEFCSENIDMLGELIERYLEVSLSQDIAKLGKDAVFLLFLAGKEFFIYGTISESFKNVDDFTKEDQDLLQPILQDYLILYTNQNLLEMFVNRVRMMQYIYEDGEKVERGNLNQLNKIFEKVETRSTFNVFPIDKSSQELFLHAIEIIRDGIDSNTKSDFTINSSMIVSDIDLEKARENLRRIRIT